MITNYAHYYMTDEELDAVHRKEIWWAFFTHGYDGLMEYQKEWFRKYFPEKYKNLKGENSNG